MARILVIDDDHLVRDTLKSFLQVEGHTVLLAVDGNDGLRQCREQIVDLVICDIFMPEKEGIETVREMRQMMPTVPIVTMTGGARVVPSASNRGQTDYLQMSRLVGATATITKPFRPRELIALVEQCLGQEIRP
jgi:two-component system, chemotaxis family, chemotaxis protein CheY